MSSRIKWFVAVWLLSGSVDAGVFLKIDRPTMDFAPFVIVHPIGYDGTGGELVIKLCPQDPDLRPALTRVVEIWNDLAAKTGNCSQCLLIEDGGEVGNPEDFFDLTSILLHEVGHCAMGLGHTNWPGTSFTATQDAVGIDDGGDGIRGSRDDTVVPFPGSRVVHWFREADNNPIVVDHTVIDSSTYTRRFQDFPSGSSWSANGNRDVAEALGFTDTHSVMYSTIEPGTRFNGLEADAVNTVALGMAGIDSVAGTGDDYTIRLEYAADCAQADIVVRYFTPEDPEDDVIGACASGIEQIDPDNTAHFRVTGPFSTIGPFIEINSLLKFDTVSADSFESGGFSEWSDVIP